MITRITKRAVNGKVAAASYAAKLAAQGAATTIHRRSRSILCCQKGAKQMYLIIAYHGKGKNEVEEDLKKLWFNYSNFVKSVKVKHVYFFQNAKDDKGADLLMIIDYRCSKSCLGTQAKSCGAGVAKQTPYHKGTGHSSALKNKSVNYWLYVRDSLHAPKKEALK